MVIEATPRNAGHLWRRAAFGATPAQIAQTMADGIEATVASMFDHRRAETVGGPKRSGSYRGYETPALNLWFLRLAATSPTPAIERLTWFWHGHFATNLDKFDSTEAMHAQLVTFRRHGLGRLDDLLKLVHRDPAMAAWLDLNLSVAGNPNENYARELLELFSLGVDGGYTQVDVVNTARAFTGHTIIDEHPLTVELNPGLHDDGEKTILGATGRFDGDDVVDLIVGLPACHRFIASRFWTRYAGTIPAPEVIDDLAGALATDLRIQDLVLALFTHPAFYRDEVIDGLVAQPMETTINAIRGFQVELLDVRATTTAEAEENEMPFAFPFWVALEMLEDMGQYLGHPPNVGGWPHNEPWLDATRATGRLNAGIRFAQAVVEGENPVVTDIAAAVARGPRAGAAAILTAFGLTEWTTTTDDAVIAALTTPTDGEPGPLATAIAVAYTSPEVTLS
ncbi:MAG: DUF1800 domain-containing protein [Actinomycetota bacterium]